MTEQGPPQQDDDETPQQAPIDDPATGEDEPSEDEPSEDDELETDVPPAFDPASP
jgi:hypothetical protein